MGDGIWASRFINQVEYGLVHTSDRLSHETVPEAIFSLEWELWPENLRT
jgi:hypothetical protein